MHCPKCGKFMRREGFRVSDPPETYWACVCGIKYTEYGERYEPLFHRDAIALIQWGSNPNPSRPSQAEDAKYGEKRFPAGVRIL